MGLIVLITVALLGSIFMLFVLIGWVQEAKGKSKKRNRASERPRMQPFLVKNGNQPTDVAAPRQTKRLSILARCNAHGSTGADQG